MVQLLARLLQTERLVLVLDNLEDSLEPGGARYRDPDLAQYMGQSIELVGDFSHDFGWAASAKCLDYSRDNSGDRPRAYVSSFTSE